MSYGASTVTRTSDRGHLAEAEAEAAETNVIEVTVVMSTFVFSSPASTKMLNTVHSWYSVFSNAYPR